jgi:DMSO/TMAO reductase YedYZ molybdopterin-dependent catalytic subunit
MATTFPAAQAGDQPAVYLISASRAGRAGVTAAGVMLAVQLIWRLNWSDNGVVQAFPEFIAAAISRLTPLSIFGAATENYGSLAKKSLFVAVLVGVLLVGYQTGRTAGRMSNQIGPGFRSRLLSGMIVAGFLWLVTNLLILPIAHLGAFASQSSYTNDILIQLALTFALFAVVWACLTAPVLQEAPSTMYDATERTTRRALITRSAATAVPIATAIALGGGTWRLLNPKERSTAAPLVTGTNATGTATGEAITVQDIVATQRANQGYEIDEATTPPDESSSLEPDAPRDAAQSSSDVTPEDDPFALYNALEAEGSLTPVLTETDDFYHVSKNFSDPRVDAGGWSLAISGLVTTPLTLTLEQLTQRATTRKITTLGCISNELNGHLIGTAEWIGVPLAELLTEAGVQGGVVDLKLHAADDYEDSIPLERALDPDSLIVVGMNGEALRDDHGFPARLIVPGIYGMKNVKWLDRIELVDHDFQGYWQTRGWSDPAPYQIWGRIDTPDGTIAPGPFTAAGMASAGDRDVSRVEVSLDDGSTWADAQIEPSINPPFTWVRWAFPFEAVDGQDFTMKIRVTDGAGTVMDEAERSPLPDGATGWPSRGVKVRG